MNQPTLFSQTVPPADPHRVARDKAIKRVEDNQSAAFRSAYERFLIEYAGEHSEFIAEDV